MKAYNEMGGISVEDFDLEKFNGNEEKPFKWYLIRKTNTIP